jgi:LysR family transcriptional regulator for bpeEF and oprC
VYASDSKISIDHPETLIEAATCGDGIVQLLPVTLMPFIRSGDLAPILDDWSAPGPIVCALHQAAKIKAFVDFAEEPSRE